MPIYEYNCKRCGDFEITQRMSEDPLKKCPACGAKVAKLISTSAFHLKGSGWYMTDYAKSGASKTPDKTPDGDSSSSSKPTETKEGSASSASSESASKESASKESTAKTDSPSTSSTKETSAST